MQEDFSTKNSYAVLPFNKQSVPYSINFHSQHLKKIEISRPQQRKLSKNMLNK